MDILQYLQRPSEERGQVWDFVRRFASHWTSSPLADHDGWSNSDLLESEQRLQLRLPIAMHEAYSLFGRRADLTANQDKLLPPTELRIDENQEALVFRDENRGAACWGILLSDLVNGDPDPPVYVKQAMADKSVEMWEPWTERFSLACLAMIIWEAMQDRQALTDYAECEADTANELESLAQYYPEVGPVSLPYFQGARFFATSDALVLAFDFGVYVRVRDEDELDSIYERLSSLSENWIEGP